MSSTSNGQSAAAVARVASAVTSYARPRSSELAGRRRVLVGVQGVPAVAVEVRPLGRSQHERVQPSIDDGHVDRVDARRLVIADRREHRLGGIAPMEELATSRGHRRCGGLEFGPGGHSRAPSMRSGPSFHAAHRKRWHGSADRTGDGSRAGPWEEIPVRPAWERRPNGVRGRVRAGSTGRSSAAGRGTRRARCRSSMSRNSTPDIAAKSREMLGRDRVAEAGVVRAAGMDPGRGVGLEVRPRPPQGAGDRQAGAAAAGGVDHVDDASRPSGSAGPCPMIAGDDGRAGLGVEHEADRVGLAADRQRVDLEPRPRRRRSTRRPRACARRGSGRPHRSGGRCSPP